MAHGEHPGSRQGSGRPWRANHSISVKNTVSVCPNPSESANWAIGFCGTVGCVKSDRDEPANTNGRGESRPQKKRRKKNTRWPGLPGPTDMGASRGESSGSEAVRKPPPADQERTRKPRPSEQDGGRRPRSGGQERGRKVRPSEQGSARRQHTSGRQQSHRPRPEEGRRAEADGRRPSGQQGRPKQARAGQAARPQQERSNHARPKKLRGSEAATRDERVRAQQARRKQNATGRTGRSSEDPQQVRRGERAQKGKPRQGQPRQGQPRQDQRRQAELRKGQPQRPRPKRLDQAGHPPRDKAARARAAKKARIVEQQKAARRRRIIIFIAMIAGIILLAAAALYLLNGRASSGAPVQEDPVEKWAPVACEQSSLDAELEIPSSSSVGSEIPLKVNLHNTSDAKPCYVDVGWDNVNVIVTSGDDEIVSSQTCEMGDQNKQLLLDRDMETSFTLSWRGGRGCGTGDLAQAGTYKATLTFSDQAADEETAVFTLE